MAKKRVSGALRDAKAYYKHLLFFASGGNLGEAPESEIKSDSMTFGEKRGLLDSIIRIAELERKASEDQEDESGFEKIQKELNASRANGDTGNRRTEEFSPAEWSRPADADSAAPEAAEDAGTEGVGV